MARGCLIRSLTRAAGGAMVVLGTLLLAERAFGL
jgi:hypothetical protein